MALPLSPLLRALLHQRVPAAACSSSMPLLTTPALRVLGGSQDLCDYGPEDLAFLIGIGYFCCTAKMGIRADEHGSVGLLEGVQRALAELPEVAVHSVELEHRVNDYVVDLAIHANVKGRPVCLLIEAKAGGYPRDARAAAWQMAPLRRLDAPVPRVPLFVAPAVSAASRDLLRAEGIGYWDPGGSLYLQLPWALYFVDRPAPRGRTRMLRSVYRGSTAQVLHALLLEPRRPWKVMDLARRAEVSVSTVHQAFTFLEDQLWMEKEGAGPKAVRHLRDPGALLDAWAGAHTLAHYVPYRLHGWFQQPDDLLHRVTQALERHAVEYALTLGTGAARVAPFTTEPGPHALLVPTERAMRTKLGDALADLSLRPVNDGEAVTLYAATDRSPVLFRRQVDEAWVASDVQLYLDLYAWPRRGKEQARHLRAERLGY